MKFFLVKEVEKKVETMQTEKQKMFETFEKWSERIGEDLTTENPLGNLLETLTTYSLACQREFLSGDLEGDGAARDVLLDVLAIHKTTHKEEIEKYKKRLDKLDVEFKKHEEDVPDEPIAKLMFSMEAVYFSKAISSFYTFLGAYYEMSLLMYRYLEKIENNQ